MCKLYLFQDKFIKDLSQYADSEFSNHMVKVHNLICNFKFIYLFTRNATNNGRKMLRDALNGTNTPVP